MIRATRFAWLPVVALVLTACADAGPVATDADFDLDASAALTVAVPDLTPEQGTAGTDRYVPTLTRVFRRAVLVVREKAGAEPAERLVAEARSLQAAVKAAREAADDAALKEAVQKLEGFQARVGIRAFGPSVVRHVHSDAAARLRELNTRLRQAHDAGQDVSQQVAGAQLVARRLSAARDAAGNERPVVALIHAAHALDLVIRVAATL